MTTYLYFYFFPRAMVDAPTPRLSSLLSVHDAVDAKHATAHWVRLAEDSDHQLTPVIKHVHIDRNRKCEIIDKVYDIMENEGVTRAYHFIDVSLHDHCTHSPCCIFYLDIELNYDEQLPVFLATSHNSDPMNAPWNTYNHTDIDATIRETITKTVHNLVHKIKPTQAKTVLRSSWWWAHSPEARKSAGVAKSGKLSFHAYWPDFVVRRNELRTMVQWVKKQLALLKGPPEEADMQCSNLTWWISDSIDVKPAEQGYLRMPWFPTMISNSHNPLSAHRLGRPFFPCTTNDFKNTNTIIDNLFDAEGHRVNTPETYTIADAAKLCLLHREAGKETFPYVVGKKSVFDPSFQKIWEADRKLIASVSVPTPALRLPDQDEEEHEADIGLADADGLYRSRIDYRRRSVVFTTTQFPKDMAVLIEHAKGQILSGISEEKALARVMRYIDRRAAVWRSDTKVWTKEWKDGRWNMMNTWQQTTWEQSWPKLGWWVKKPCPPGEEQKLAWKNITRIWAGDCQYFTGMALNTYSFENRLYDDMVFPKGSNQLQEFSELECWYRYDQSNATEKDLYWVDHFIYHLRYVLCNGDAVAAWNVLMIILNCVHHPEDPIRLVTMFQGDEGTGKSRPLQWILTYIFGKQHSLTVCDPKRDIMGQFNAIIKGKLFVLIEESAVGKSQDHISIMNHLVTGKDFVINGKNTNQNVCPVGLAMFLCTNATEYVTGMGGLQNRRYFLIGTNNLICDAEQKHKTEFFNTVLNPLLGEEDHPNEESLNAITHWLLEDESIKLQLDYYRKYVRYAGAVTTQKGFEDRLNKIARKDSVTYWLITCAIRGSIGFPRESSMGKLSFKQSYMDADDIWPASDVPVPTKRLFSAYALFCQCDDKRMGKTKPVGLTDFIPRFIACSGIEYVNGAQEGFWFRAPNGTVAAVRAKLEIAHPGLNFKKMFEAAYEKSRNTDIWNEVNRVGSIWKSPLFRERFPLPEFDTKPGKEIASLMEVGHQWMKEMHGVDSEPTSAMDYSSDTDNTEESVHASTYKRPLAEEVDEVVVNDASGDEAIYMEAPHKKRKCDSMGVPLRDSSSDGSK